MWGGGEFCHKNALFSSGSASSREERRRSGQEGRGEGRGWWLKDYMGLVHRPPTPSPSTPLALLPPHLLNYKPLKLMLRGLSVSKRLKTGEDWWQEKSREARGGREGKGAAGGREVTLAAQPPRPPSLGSDLFVCRTAS